jgi:hypothetical protein
MMNPPTAQTIAKNRDITRQLTIEYSGQYAAQTG